MRQLADFVDRMMVDSPTRPGRRRGRVRPATPPGRAIGVLGIPGDRRDDDQREYGAIAAGAFDEIIVREDKNLRGRAPGRDRPANVLEGVEAAKAAGGGARPAAPRRSSRRWPPSGPALRRASPGDLVVCASTTRSASIARRWPRPGRPRRDGLRRPGRAERPRGLTVAR